MRKGDGGLRPIAIGSIYRRLACRIAARHVATTVGEELRPVRLGVGTPQGCEAAVHATREYLAVAGAAGSPHLLVKLDVRNAFNTVRRDVFLSQVKARASAVYPLLRNTYSEPTQLCIHHHNSSSQFLLHTYLTHRVEWGKTHTFWKAGSVSQSSEDNDLIPFPADTSNICLQNIGETAP